MEKAAELEVLGAIVSAVTEDWPKALFSHQAFCCCVFVGPVLQKKQQQKTEGARERALFSKHFVS